MAKIRFIIIVQLFKANFIIAELGISLISPSVGRNNIGLRETCKSYTVSPDWFIQFTIYFHRDIWLVKFTCFGTRCTYWEGTQLTRFWWSHIDMFILMSLFKPTFSCAFVHVMSVNKLCQGYSDCERGRTFYGSASCHALGRGRNRFVHKYYGYLQATESFWTSSS